VAEGKLVSMKIDPKKREEKYAESALVDRPVYPWGLSINLDEDALEALGMTDLPEVGKPMKLLALVDVTSVSSNESKGGASRSVGLQITDLCLEKAGEKKSTESKLYKE
jgi:hypothetical protein